jgi:hypothetical protein
MVFTRKNLSFNTIQSAFIPEYYSSLLVNKLLQQLEWFGKYGLRAEDFTRQSGLPA